MSSMNETETEDVAFAEVKELQFFMTTIPHLENGVSIVLWSRLAACQH